MNAVVPIMETPGLTEKPLYRIAEICLLFNITRPTLDAWIADKKLRRVKIRGKVYFIGSEVRGLMEGK